MIEMYTKCKNLSRRALFKLNNLHQYILTRIIICDPVLINVVIFKKKLKKMLLKFDFKICICNLIFTLSLTFFDFF
jgi:hypothetical protein